MKDIQERLFIEIAFPIAITLYTFLFYMVILVLIDNKTIDFGFFSILLIVIGSFIGIIWRFLPHDIKLNFISQKLYGGYVNGDSFLNKVTYCISVLTIFIGVVIGFLNYIFS